MKLSSCVPHSLPPHRHARPSRGPLWPFHPVNVELAVDTRPRTVEIPADLSEAFTANPAARSFFDTLSNSLQRYHVDNINAAKAADTRQRRLDKTIGLFLDHKQR